MKLNVILFSLLWASAFLFVGCEPEKIDRTPALKNQVLNDISTGIIVAIYKDLDTASGELLQAITALKNDPTEPNFKNAREKWWVARSLWEQSEGFLYGPAETQNLDPAVDSWPVDTAAMNLVVKDANQTITADLLANNDDARGFHLIEFLLWGAHGSGTVADLAVPRKQAYLLAAAEDLRRNVKTLYDAWRADAGGANYVANFTNPIAGAYADVNAALVEIVGGLVSIADEVGNTKMNTPLNPGGEPQPEKEESRFSNNSKRDYKDNIQSVKYIYEGWYKTFRGKGLSDLVQLKDKALDQRIRAQIDAALKSIEDIKGTFGEAIHNDKDGVKKAIQTLQTLQDLLEKELNPLITKI